MLPEAAGSARLHLFQELSILGQQLTRPLLLCSEMHSANSSCVIKSRASTGCGDLLSHHLRFLKCRYDVQVAESALPVPLVHGT